MRTNFQNEENAVPKRTKDATRFGITLFKGNKISLWQLCLLVKDVETHDWANGNNNNNNKLIAIIDYVSAFVQL